MHHANTNNGECNRIDWNFCHAYSLHNINHGYGHLATGHLHSWSHFSFCPVIVASVVMAVVFHLVAVQPSWFLICKVCCFHIGIPCMGIPSQPTWCANKLGITSHWWEWSFKLIAVPSWMNLLFDSGRQHYFKLLPPIVLPKVGW